MGAPAISETPLFDTCECDDEELQVMRDLVARGVPQYDASLIAFGHPPRADASFEVHRFWIRLQVRRLGNMHRAELGLDPMPVTVDAVYPPPLYVRLARATHALRKVFRVYGRAMETAAKQLQRAFAVIGPECDGSSTCQADLHVHGCFADRDGSACDDPGWHQ